MKSSFLSIFLVVLVCALKNVVSERIFRFRKDDNFFSNGFKTQTTPVD